MSFNLNNPFSENKILGPGETDPKADVELARTLLGDEAAEDYAEALAGSAHAETLSDGFTDEEKAIFEKHASETKEWEEKKRWEHIPGERIELTIGGKTKEELLAEMKAKGITVDNSARDLIDKITFPESKEKLTFVRLSFAELGFPEGATIEELYEKAKELGLEVVPPETALYLAPERLPQPSNEYLFVGMEPISDRSGFPCVLRFFWNGFSWCLCTDSAKPTDGLIAFDKIIFRLPDAKK